MTEPLKLLIAACALAAPAGVGAPATAGAPAIPMTATTPVFSQLLSFSYPPGFAPAFENTRGPLYIQESVPLGETVERWTQMLTATGIKGAAANPTLTPTILAESIAGAIRRVCPASFSAVPLGGAPIDGHDSFALVSSCGDSPLSHTSETTLLVAIKGLHDYYTVQWAERGPASPAPLLINTEIWRQRFRRLAPIKLCPIVEGEAAPYLSCANRQ